jgi:hypothetical protein
MKLFLHILDRKILRIGFHEYAEFGYVEDEDPVREKLVTWV